MRDSRPPYLPMLVQKKLDHKRAVGLLVHGVQLSFLRENGKGACTRNRERLRLGRRSLAAPMVGTKARSSHYDEPIALLDGNNLEVCTDEGGNVVEDVSLQVSRDIVNVVLFELDKVVA